MKARRRNNDSTNSFDEEVTVKEAIEVRRATVEHEVENLMVLAQELQDDAHAWRHGTHPSIKPKHTLGFRLKEARRSDAQAQAYVDMATMLKDML